MQNENHHAAFVDAWMTRTARDLPSSQHVDLFARAFAALWRTTAATLGEITLWAIANRVVRTGREKFPWLAPVKVEPGGFSFKALPTDEAAPSPADAAPALRFLLVELLTVLGKLTGEILTPELHAELARTGREKPPDGKGAGRKGAREEKTMEHPHGE